jgi:uncharacterized protein YkwD
MFRKTAIASAISALAFGVPCSGAAAAKRKPHAGKAKVKAATSSCPGDGSVPVDEATRQQAGRAVLCLVNRERTVHGAQAVRASHPLATAAAAHSADMVAARFFSHAGADGESLRQRVQRTGYIRASRYTLLGETLAWGMGSFATPGQLLESFMASRVHRQTLLDRRYRDIGVGMTLGAPMANVGGPAATLTLDFGRR